MLIFMCPGKIMFIIRPVNAVTSPIPFSHLAWGTEDQVRRWPPAAGGGTTLAVTKASRTRLVGLQRKIVCSYVLLMYLGCLHTTSATQLLAL
jgi:hypothetical protein